MTAWILSRNLSWILSWTISWILSLCAAHLGRLPIKTPNFSDTFL